MATCGSPRRVRARLGASPQASELAPGNVTAWDLQRLLAPTIPCRRLLAYNEYIHPVVRWGPCQAASNPVKWLAACAPLHGEPSGEGRFLHAAEAAGIGFRCWVFQEGAHNIVWTSAASLYCVAHSRKQEEVALSQRLGCQHPVRWRCRRIILALQDQRRDGAQDRLLLDRRHRFHLPELTGREEGQVKVEQRWLGLRRKSLDGCLQSMPGGESHIFATLH